MKSLKNRVRSNKLNVWLILLGVGLLFVVFYYFLGKKFGIRESMTQDKDYYDYENIPDLITMAGKDHARILTLEKKVFGSDYDYKDQDGEFVLNEYLVNSKGKSGKKVKNTKNAKSAKKVKGVNKKMENEDLKSYEVLEDVPIDDS
jgi:hypothetical protein